MPRVCLVQGAKSVSVNMGPKCVNNTSATSVFVLGCQECVSKYGWQKCVNKLGAKRVFHPGCYKYVCLTGAKKECTVAYLEHKTCIYLF